MPQREERTVRKLVKNAKGTDLITWRGWSFTAFYPSMIQSTRIPILYDNLVSALQATCPISLLPQNAGAARTIEGTHFRSGLRFLGIQVAAALPEQ